MELRKPSKFPILLNKYVILFIWNLTVQLGRPSQERYSCKQRSSFKRPCLVILTTRIIERLRKGRRRVRLMDRDIFESGKVVTASQDFWIPVPMYYVWDKGCTVYRRKDAPKYPPNRVVPVLFMGVPSKGHTRRCVRDGVEGLRDLTSRSGSHCVVFFWRMVWGRWRWEGSLCGKS